MCAGRTIELETKLNFTFKSPCSFQELTRKKECGLSNRPLDQSVRSMCSIIFFSQEIKPFVSSMFTVNLK